MPPATTDPNNPFLIPQVAQPSGLLLSFDHENPIPFDVDMPYSSSLASGSSSQPPSLAAESSHVTHRSHFSQLPPIDTNLRGFGSALPAQHARSEPSTPAIPSSVSHPIPSARNGVNVSPASILPPSAQELRQLYFAGRIHARTSGVRTWELECSNCATWINSSVSCTRKLTEDGHFKTLEQHMQGKRCKPSNNNPSASLSRAASFSSRPPSGLSPPAFSPASSTASLPPMSPASTSPYLPSWSPIMNSPSLQFIEESPTNQRRMPERFSSAPPQLQPMDIDHPAYGGACAGLNLEWPEELSFRLTFPFHRLTLRGDEGDLPFEIEIHERGEVITVWSKRCKKSTTQYSPHCHECSALHGRLEDLAQIARDARKGTNYKL
ncbi:hypothetical protein B0H14DRAFT_3450885 [Mycena olivaceomarginata]|nr:hypothetical protein B0H14DRAFT_3450885 [Mycena olivaceomarginata]